MTKLPKVKRSELERAVANCLNAPAYSVIVYPDGVIKSQYLGGGDEVEFKRRGGCVLRAFLTAKYGRQDWETACAMAPRIIEKENLLVEAEALCARLSAQG